MQAASNTDFEVEVKFQSVMNAEYQQQGIIVEQDNGNYLRFDFVRDATKTRVFAASIVGGSAGGRIAIPITGGNPLYLRVKRVGNVWTESYSYNGTSWTSAGSFTQTLTVSSVGPFIGNYGSGNTAPAFTGSVDYFFNTASPVVPEDPTALARSMADPASQNAFALPEEFSLTQNYPNPFNPSTTIRYELPHASRVSLKVYNMLGQQVATLVNETKDAGIHEVKFDNSNLTSGVYFYRLEAGDFVQTKKLAILK
jgi:hypothetical protein